MPRRTISSQRSLISSSSRSSRSATSWTWESSTHPRRSPRRKRAATDRCSSGLVFVFAMAGVLIPFRPLVLPWSAGAGWADGGIRAGGGERRGAAGAGAAARAARPRQGVGGARRALPGVHRPVTAGAAGDGGAGRPLRRVAPGRAAGVRGRPGRAAAGDSRVAGEPSARLAAERGDEPAGGAALRDPGAGRDAAG